MFSNSSSSGTSRRCNTPNPARVSASFHEPARTIWVDAAYVPFNWYCLKLTASVPNAAATRRKSAISSSSKTGVPGTRDSVKIGSLIGRLSRTGYSGRAGQQCSTGQPHPSRDKKPRLGGGPSSRSGSTSPPTVAAHIAESRRARSTRSPEACRCGPSYRTP